MDFTGKPLRSMVYVDPPGIRTAARLQGWVGEALGFAASLPREGAKRPAERRRKA